MAQLKLDMTKINHPKKFQAHGARATGDFHEIDPVLPVLPIRANQNE